jgi:hypothetical protein
MLFSEWIKDKMEDDDPRLESLIRRGLSLSEDRAKTVWDELLSLIGGNKNEFAELMGVRPDVIAKASHRIGKILRKVREDDDSEDKRRVKRTMLHTGT